MKTVPYFLKDFRDWCHHQGLEGCRGEGSHYIPIQLSYLVCAEDREFCSTTVDYHKLNQVVTPLADLLYQRWFPYGGYIYSPVLCHSLFHRDPFHGISQ